MPCAATAHGIPEAQPFERLQSTIMPDPSPEKGLIHSQTVSRTTSLSQHTARHIFCDMGLVPVSLLQPCLSQSLYHSASYVRSRLRCKGLTRHIALPSG